LSRGPVSMISGS